MKLRTVNRLQKIYLFSMKRTPKQQASIELFCKQGADAFNEAGITRQEAIELITLELPWSQESFKELVWRTMQKAKGWGDKTSELETEQVAGVYEWCNLFTGKFGISVKFPSDEEEMLEDKKDDKWNFRK